MNYFKAHKFPILFIISSLLFYFSFAYNLDRTDTVKLLSLYTGVFFLYYKVLQFEKSNLKLLFWFGVLSRLVFIAAVPNLSQDFYRFLWDGQLINHGINPYLYTPAELMTSGEIKFPTAQQLYDGMGALSAGHYSNYPPVSQFFYYLSSFFGGNSIMGSVLFLRICIILADIGILIFAQKILVLLGHEQHKAYWYFLNPFICIELTGNLHFEGIMLFLFTVALYLLLKRKWIGSAVAIGLSIATKLIPLLLLPVFVRWLCLFPKSGKLNWNLVRPLGYYSITILVALLVFIPFFSAELIQKYTQTLGLWFKSFEFNASFYYVIREIGYAYKGYNIIESAGLRMAVVVAVFILLLSFLRKNEQPKVAMGSLLFAITFYLAFTTTVHPWYVATPLLLCVFTNYKFPVVWSFIVVLSYVTYAQAGFQENPWILALEYLILYGCFVREVHLKQPILKHL